MKYRRTKRKTYHWRRKRTTKRSNKPARRQQRAAMTYIRKKYTAVEVLNVNPASDVYERTISLIGGKNLTNPANTFTLTRTDNDNQLAADMRLYQFFRIRGVAIKLFFPMPTTPDASPVQWVTTYSAN